jgi:hypothetical protein
MRNDIKYLIVNSLFGFVVCGIIGILMYDFTIFKFNDSRSQLISFGLFGAIFYSVLKYGKPTEIIFVGLMIFVGNVLFQGRALTLDFLIRDIVFMSSLFGALFIYKIFINNYNILPMFVRAFALSIFLGLLNIIATLFLILIFNPSSFEINQALFYNAQYSSLIGIGLGIGFDLFDKYQYNIFSQSKSSVT